MRILGEEVETQDISAVWGGFHYHWSWRVGFSTKEMWWGSSKYARELSSEPSPWHKHSQSVHLVQTFQEILQWDPWISPPSVPTCPPLCVAACSSSDEYAPLSPERREREREKEGKRGREEGEGEEEREKRWRENQEEGEGGSDIVNMRNRAIFDLQKKCGVESYLHKSNVKFLACVPSCKVSPDVHVIVSHNARNDVRCRHSLCALCRHKLSHVLQRFVDILRVCWVVGEIVMGNKINLEVGEKMNVIVFCAHSLFFYW